MKSEQFFKPLYFPANETAYKQKAITLAFGKKHADLYKNVIDLGSSDLRNLLGTVSYSELKQRAEREGLSINTYCLWYLNKNFDAKKPQLKIESGEKTISQFENKVLEGDCLEIMKTIPSKSIDMILCDLPYGTTQNHWDSVIPLDRLWTHYERIIKDNGVIALTGQGLFTAQLILSNPKLFKYKITWIKSKSTNFLNAKKQPLRKHEDICIFYKSQPSYNPQMTYGEPYNKGFRKDQLTGSYGDFKTVEVKSDGQRYPSDVVYFKTAESEGPVFHPTQKPIDLGRYLIRTFTKTGDIVLDNTCGSGSFLVSALLEGRKFIGIEKNENASLHKKHDINYVEISKKRVREAIQRYETKDSELFISPQMVLL
jgi:site-specific DNA-methyltransferase (adenine-specific)